MAFALSSPFANIHFPRVMQMTRTQPKQLFCLATSTAPNVSDQSTLRRSGNYKPNIWDFDFVQSLNSEYREEKYTNCIEKLKEEVKLVLIKPKDYLDQLELIDTIQRLGLDYHFEDEIQQILTAIYDEKHHEQSGKDLHTTSLQFRLFRQHGFSISQDVFCEFQDKAGNFKASLSEDHTAILSLYEASFLSEENDNILDVAREFSKNILENFAKQNHNSYLLELINRALDQPLHWRMERLEARWFIEVYKTKQDMSPLLLELAILDFNKVQAIYQTDLQYASRWWESTCFRDKLEFARDRITESFFWTIGMIYQPEYGHSRRMSTKINALIVVLDDIYDVYGTVEELQLLTDVVESWDVDGIEKLPHYMQIWFLQLHTTISEIGYDVLKEHGFHVIPYMKKAWADLCKAYFTEAKWYHSAYTPTFAEYIENRIFSISALVILLHAYFIKEPITSEGIKHLMEYSDIIQYSAIILGLADDLGTSSDEMKRGDVKSSIQCYMDEKGVSEEEARKHINYIILETWKKMNKEVQKDLPLSKTFISVAANLARMGQCMYQYGDAHGIQDFESKDRILSLIVQPIPLN